MDNSTVENLREALKYSPDNVPLRMHLAETLFKLNRLDEAEAEYQEVLKLNDHSKAKFGLAKVFFAREEFSKCNVILEELVATGNPDFDVLLLHTKALVREEEIALAIDTYQRALEMRPDFTDEELDKKLRVTSYDFEDNPIDDSDPKFLQKPKIKFEDVGGMENVKKEIDLKIIQPLKHPDLYKAYGKKIGGGILLYGPPGCGKTFLAKATAGQVNARFISVSLNDILDMWIGNSEKNLHEVFEIARKNTPCVLFFDEIDALGASRSDMKHSGSRHLINQFLQELDGIDDNNDGVLVLGATNAPWHLDPAFRRPGRFDRIVFVPPPDQLAREAIFRLKLKDKPTDAVDYSSLSKNTTDFSGADIEAAIDISVEEKLEQAIQDGVPKPLSTKDLQKAIKKHRPTTREWFTTAKNFALYSNESGLYDDILTYLNIKK
jgi:SpoVK/Ycf46/Vps4 family AAA+-type ATPase